MLRKLIYGLSLAFFVYVPAYAQLPDFTDLVKHTGDAVVNISTVQKSNDAQTGPDAQLPPDLPPEMEEFFKRFYQSPGRGNQAPREASSLGSGFIISRDGYLMKALMLLYSSLKARIYLLLKLVIPMNYKWVSGFWLLARHLVLSNRSLLA